MSWTKIRIVLGLLLLAPGPGLGAAPGRPSPSRAIFPPQRITLSFAHDRHLELGVLGCTDCHAARTSQRSSDRLIPDHAVCESCHRMGAGDPGLARIPKATMASRCTLCHPRMKEGRAPVPLTLPEPNLHFSHAEHLERGIDCARCHGDLRRLGLATRDQLPTMDTCLSCHDGSRGAQKAASACTTCHLERAGGGLRTDFPGGKLVPRRTFVGILHDESFARSHALPARSQPETCRACHATTECIDCHEGSLKPFDLHPADWLSIHPVAARQATLSCSGCHRAQSFCITCHERIGIGRDAPTGRVRGGDVRVDPTFRSPTTNLRVHPKGWADLDASQSPDHHSVHARRNIETCISCHREETCLSCHATLARGGLSVSPHPSSVLARCRQLARATPRACAKCHAGEGGPCP